MGLLWDRDTVACYGDVEVLEGGELEPLVTDNYIMLLKLAGCP